MQDINHQHEYGNLLWIIPNYDGKNKDLAECLLQIEKLALLTCS